MLKCKPLACNARVSCPVYILSDRLAISLQRMENATPTMAEAVAVAVCPTVQLSDWTGRVMPSL